MRTMLPKMLGALMCVMAVWADFQPTTMANFDVTKVTGKWFTVGYGSNSQWFANNKHAMKTGGVFLEIVDGKLRIAYSHLNPDNSCWRMDHLADTTGIPGHFTYHSPVWNNDNDIRFTDVVYNEYALVHTTKTSNGVSEVLTELFTRSPVPTPAVAQKFLELSRDSGIRPDNAIILPPHADCP